MPDGDLPIDELVEILEQSHCHRDLVRYVKRAEERGGTPILSSMKYQLNHVSVERFASRGTPIEQALVEEGAAGALRCGNLDVTNTEICESIMEGYH